MPVHATCPHCDKVYRLADEVDGKKIRCKNCQGTFVVEAVDREPPRREARPEHREASPVRQRYEDRPADEDTGHVRRRQARPHRQTSGLSISWLVGLAVAGVVMVAGAGGMIWALKTKRQAPDLQAHGEQRATAATEAHRGPVYAQRRAAFHTKLLRTGPSPQPWQPEIPPKGVREVLYPSGDLKLKAWVQVPPGSEDSRKAALVYLHGGFAFGADDLEDCQPFLEAGMVVMCPMFRGENGNPGNFELFMGEVDDAKAAIHWLAAQPYVAKGQIYVFGHSSGGGVSALLSLHGDVPIQHGGSSGGLYDVDTFDGWSKIVPFDLRNPEERSLRVLLGNIRQMRHRHYAYLGSADNFQPNLAKARQEIGSGPALLEIAQMPGDHFTSLGPAMNAYLKVIQQSRTEGKP